jgi:hypothetical protein
MNNLKEYNGIRYYYIEDGSIGVFSIIDKNATECVIPSEIDGIAVTSITNNAFSDCNLLESCIIPEGIVHISHNAFEKCYNLKSIELPESLTHIGDRAFNYCSSLIQVVIPENVTCVGTGAFGNCEQLRHVLIENPKCYYEYAFTVYPNALLEKKNIKTRNVVNNIFAFQYSESEFTKFALMRDCNNIQIQHISGSVPHVYDIIRALKLQPDYLLNIPKRRYKFSILTNFSERGRGYYKLVYFKKPVDVQQGVIGAYSVGCKVEVNSTGKLEDWINKDFYINDLLDILYKATGDYHTNEIISKKVHTMEPHHTIEYDSSKSILDLDVD